ncbi:MAG TPA: SigB/SigF/SigG family RNA polymerase sigma factor [Streptosporangiaceae bacterium]|nr:SigB/SigF/SigG family RNA polymerase sigma factor [Streptosporangiaceae bacterium]
MPHQAATDATTELVAAPDVDEQSGPLDEAFAEAALAAMAKAGDIRTLSVPSTSARWNQREVRDLTDRLLMKLSGLDPDNAERDKLRQCLVQLNMPLVRSAARRYHSRSEPMEDILQVGTIGLIKAIDRFDPERGSFLAFAIPTIAGEIKRFFRDTSWWVRVPRRLRDRRLELVRTSDDLTQRLGRGPTTGELAEHLRLDEEEVIEGLDVCAAYSTSSLDAAQFGDDETATLTDLLGVEDSGLDLIEYRQDLEPALGELPAREREIVLLRYYGNMTQTQIGELVGISQMHVSRLLTRSLEQLRARLGAVQ